MKILFTGSSSFTGFWFIQELVRQGHDVTATFRAKSDRYRGIRKERVDQLLSLCPVVFECPFGSEKFLKLFDEDSFDLLCHHAAQVENYKSDDFDAVAALSNNTYRIREVLCRHRGRVVITGSIAEKGEGNCFGQNQAFSPYGLSKFLTSEVFQFEAHKLGLPLGKFVIPNPFGPYEEERFTYWLIKNWFQNQTPEVKTPYYIRDNIHVSLLAKVYARFAAEAPSASFYRLNPSGYISSQEEFAKRFSEKMRECLNLPCAYTIYPQTDFLEPKMRVNKDPADPKSYDWDEEEAWREIAAYYRQRHTSGVLC